MASSLSSSDKIAVLMLMADLPAWLWLVVTFATSSVGAEGDGAVVVADGVLQLPRNTKQPAPRDSRENRLLRIGQISPLDVPIAALKLKDEKEYIGKLT